MTAALLPAPELQFINGDGQPIAGGTVETYIPGTSTPKQTWLDQAQTALNTNPIVLNSDGRCIIFADGDYRIILRDSVGNLVYDQLSSTGVSAAMYPVVSAPTIADAVHQLGIDDMIATEAADRAAADSAEQTARTSADTALGVRIDDEIARATAAEAALDTRVDALESAPGPAGITGVQGGAAATDGSGLCHLIFPTPFVTACIACVVTPDSNLFVSQTVAVDYRDRFSIDIRLTVAGSATPVTGGEFQWIAYGN